MSLSSQPLLGTGPDLEHDQLPPSTFAPPPVNVPALDYDTVIAECDRLLWKVLALKRAAGLACVLFVLSVASAPAQTVEVRPPLPTPTPTPPLSLSTINCQLSTSR